MGTLGIATLTTSVDTKGLKAGLAQSKALVSGNISSILSMSSGVLAGAGLAVTAVTGVAVAVGKLANETMNYGLQVGDLAGKIGTSTEEASRWIQMADDLRISTQQLGVGFRNLQQQGIQPTIDNIANLADEYVALRDPVKQAQFAMEMFGARGGPELQRLLAKGRQGVLAMSDAIADGLVLSEEQVQAAQELFDAQDALNDQWQALSTTVGNKVIPGLTSFLGLLNTLTSTSLESGWSVNFLGDLLGKLAARGRDLEPVIGSWEDRMRAAAQEARQLAAGVEGVTDAMQDESEQGLLTAAAKAKMAGNQELYLQYMREYNAVKLYNNELARTEEFLKGLTSREWNIEANMSLGRNQFLGGGGGAVVGGAFTGGQSATDQAWRNYWNGTGPRPPGGQQGLDMVVPPGFPNDSFPVLASSGEHVAITPKGESGGVTVNITIGSIGSQGDLDSFLAQMKQAIRR